MLVQVKEVNLVDNKLFFFIWTAQILILCLQHMKKLNSSFRWFEYNKNFLSEEKS